MTLHKYVENSEALEMLFGVVRCYFTCLLIWFCSWEDYSEELFASVDDVEIHHEKSRGQRRGAWEICSISKRQKFFMMLSLIIRERCKNSFSAVQVRVNTWAAFGTVVPFVIAILDKAPPEALGSVALHSIYCCFVLEFWRNCSNQKLTIKSGRMLLLWSVCIGVYNTK